jgi:chemotaxis protein CheY-P-specific phosphatase CheC
VRLEIWGEGNGGMLVLFPLPGLCRMLRRLTGRSERSHPSTAEEQSVVEEIGNIVVSSFLNGLSDGLGRRLLHTPPQYLYGPVGEMIRHFLTSLGATHPEALVVHAVFEDTEQRILGRLLALPRISALETLRAEEGPV